MTEQEIEKKADSETTRVVEFAKCHGTTLPLCVQLFLCHRFKELLEEHSDKEYRLQQQIKYS